MYNKTSNQALLDVSYVMKPANGEMKVAVKTKKGLGVEVPVHPIYVKTHYSIDTNGGGYTGL